ncbi:MAG: N-acetylmuramoyl-L-alanine amidase [Bacteroidota bacterium]|nr:N-acetylmuramoyl-L-alanine amidase [Bacteroidota bacterium]
MILLSILLFSITTEAQIPKKIKTIIVDPGHGGEDNGAKGEYEGTLGSKEKNITLAISMKLVDELRKQMPDVTIIPTRTTDVFNSVREKAQFANDHHGDLFVCIHADAVTLKTGSRITGHKKETYYTTHYVGKGKKRKKVRTPHVHTVAIREYYKIPTQRKGTSTLILVARQSADKIKALENSDLPFETADNDSTVSINYDSPEWKASALIYSQHYFKKSYELASDVQEEIAKYGRDDLGVWQRQKGLWVLHATQMPAVLIETGFISNYQDERYLNSEKGQQEIAEAITRALIRYRNQVEMPQGNASAAK